MLLTLPLIIFSFKNISFHISSFINLFQSLWILHCLKKPSSLHYYFLNFHYSEFYYFKFFPSRQLISPPTLVFKFLLYIGALLINNVVLVSGV